MSPRNKELSEQMREEARTALLAAAGKLFADQGYFKSKVSDVARAAGMSQGNVYWYFASKEELLKALLADGFDRLGEILVESAALPANSESYSDHSLDCGTGYAYRVRAYRAADGVFSSYSEVKMAVTWQCEGTPGYHTYLPILLNRFP